MSPRSPDRPAPPDPTTTVDSVEKAAFAEALHTIAKERGPDGGGSQTMTLKTTKLLRTRLALAAMIEDGYGSMNAILVEAADEWLERHGYPGGS
jgi:hypothetical protein